MASRNREGFKGGYEAGVDSLCPQFYVVIGSSIQDNAREDSDAGLLFRQSMLHLALDLRHPCCMLNGGTEVFLHRQELSICHADVYPAVSPGID